MPKKKAVAKAIKKKVAKKAVKKLVKAPRVAAKGAKKATVVARRLPKSDKPAKHAIPPAPKSIEPAKAEPTLGRPLVTQEEKLYMLFHDDYQCRQVFEFLRVETVKELEEFSAQQIVHLMSRPIRLTVDRIRQRLAQFKRSLKDDEQFAAAFQVAKSGESPAKR